MTERIPSTRVVDVAVGVVFDEVGRVLLAQRRPGTHLADLWEFPGGKIAPDEPGVAALSRELQEEVGITPRVWRPLMDVSYAYPEKTVRLRVWRVDAFDGVAEGREGQAISWVAPQDLKLWPLPPADRPIVTAILLPDVYLITPEPSDDFDVFLQQLDASLARGVRLVQLRSKALDVMRRRTLWIQAMAVCAQRNAQVLINTDWALAEELGAAGVHLTAAQLTQLNARPLPASYFVSASCHDITDIEHAKRLQVDFAVLGPVAPTPTHAGHQPLGWTRFADMLRLADFPVYGLGGLQRSDLSTAWAHGAQGVAGISAFWSD
jgi:8-oxo-dGTP diphosphatase